VGPIATVCHCEIRLRKERDRMKWAFFLVGSAGLLTGAGCASQQPYAYYPPGYSPPVVATPAQYPTVAAQPQYYVPPTAPVAGAAPPTTQPVMYAAPQQTYAAPQQAPVMYQSPQQACVQCCPCQ